jgi:hypothetical protein
MASDKHKVRRVRFCRCAADMYSLAILCLMTIATVPAMQAQTYNIIGNFGNNGTGVNPLYVTLDAAGNVYGTTYYGGTQYLGYGGLQAHPSRFKLAAVDALRLLRRP